MKKISIILFVIFILPLLGVGCKQNRDTTKKDYFEKKQVCISYKKEIEDQYSIVDNGIFSSVTKIFYSPVRNSCLFTTYETYSMLGSGYYIYDYMTKEQIFNFSDTSLLDKKVVELESDL